MFERCDGKSLLIIQNKIDIQSATQPPLEPCSLATIGTQETSNLKSQTSNLKSQTSNLKPPTSNLLRISAKQGTNLDQLEQAIFDAADIPELTEQDIIVSSARQYHSLLSAQENLSRVLSSLESGLSGDLVSEDLKLVLDDLADITGEGRILTSAVLVNIFTHFCVGK